MYCSVLAILESSFLLLTRRLMPLIHSFKAPWSVAISSTRPPWLWYFWAIFACSSYPLLLSIPFLLFKVDEDDDAIELSEPERF